MDLDRTTRESLIVKLVYKPRRYSIRRAEARKACVPLNNVSEFTRSRRMATSRPGRNILNDASLCESIEGGTPDEIRSDTMQQIEEVEIADSRRRLF